MEERERTNDGTLESPVIEFFIHCTSPVEEFNIDRHQKAPSFTCGKRFHFNSSNLPRQYGHFTKTRLLPPGITGGHSHRNTRSSSIGSLPRLQSGFLQMYFIST